MKKQKSSGRVKPKMDRKEYAEELRQVQVELCKVQDWETEPERAASSKRSQSA